MHPIYLAILQFRTDQKFIKPKVEWPPPELQQPLFSTFSNRQTSYKYNQVICPAFILVKFSLFFSSLRSSPREN